MDAASCLPLNQKFKLQGTGTHLTDLMSLLRFKISPCSNLTDPSRPCAPQSDIDNMFSLKKNFNLMVHYTNPVINPNQPDYISYKMVCDYFIFSKDFSVKAEFFFSDYIINNDYSLLPFVTNEIKQGMIIQDRGIGQTFLRQKSYLQINIMRKGNSLIYHRSVQKISTVISYIGGVVGAITALMFLVKFYTDFSY
jgi:hypothetical protein